MTWVNPRRLRVSVDGGMLEDAATRYEKRLGDLAGLYADAKAFDHLCISQRERIVYSVTDFRPSDRSGDLILGVTCMAPGKVGDEFFLTRGHIHANANRPEIYYGQRGIGLMQMESPAGETHVVAIEPQAICYVPPYWIHRSINVGDDDLVMMFCYPADSGQDYSIIERSRGMRHRVVSDDRTGWKLIENKSYVPRSERDVQTLFATAE